VYVEIYPTFCFGAIDMEHLQRLAKMCALMTVYGVVLGAIAGTLVGATILMVDASPADILRELAGLIFLSVFYGGMFGGMYGGFSGFISGLMMALVTAVGFREIRNLKTFRYAMGIVTAVVTLSVFVLGGLWDLGIGMELTWTAAMIMSVVIAVYASQIVSKKYFQEIGLQKKKKGVA